MKALGGDDGFILPTVLWTLALLAVVTLAITAATRLDIRTQANLTEARRATLLADGIALALGHRLARGTGGNQASFVSGSPVSCIEGNSVVAMTVTDVAGLVDLNAAPPALLVALFIGLGADDARAEALATAVVDARDADDVTPSGGPEHARYTEAGLPFGPKNLPFESIIEIDQIPGMLPDFADVVARFVTVHSRRPDVDRRLAPRELVEALDRSSKQQTTPVPGQAAPLQSRIQTIEVSVSTSAGGMASRRAVMEFAPQHRSGFVLRDWLLPRGRSGAPDGRSKPDRCAELLR